MPKGGNKCDIRNYRPICIQNVMPKLFEGIIACKLSSSFKNILIAEQHGFMPGRSTSTNLLEYQHYLINSIEKERQVDVIYTDFRKAFDSVSHSILLSKLDAFGIRSTAFSWLSSFLSGRFLRVKYKDCYSSRFLASSGVPQGSHLGPLLFNLFINDIGEVFVHSKFLLYADDLKIFLSIGNRDDALLLQHDLDRLSEWSDTNKLDFNLSKCNIVRFNRKRDVIIFYYKTYLCSAHCS